MTNYEKLQQIIVEIDILIAKGVTSDTPEFKAWNSKAERFLNSYYGEKSIELKQFKKEDFSLHIATLNTPHSAWVDACKRGLLATKAILQTYLEELSEDKTTVSHKEKKQNNMTKIFIVHGHDGELRQSVTRLIEKQGIEAIVLCEKANQGSTIIEKIEKYSDVGGAVCLFTADDIGSVKSATEQSSRARQNVVLETGYFMGKLGRDHIAILADDKIEMPSDLSGVVYTNVSNWQVDLLKELKAMGYKIDFNKLFES